MVKTRKLNGERYHLQLETGIKNNAEMLAEKARRQGFKARVVKQEWKTKYPRAKRTVYKVYTRSYK